LGWIIVPLLVLAVVGAIVSLLWAIG